MITAIIDEPMESLSVKVWQKYLAKVRAFIPDEDSRKASLIRSAENHIEWLKKEWPDAQESGQQEA
ncbi:MAG: hypothetical protein LBI31_02365 [Zoogloeaceae bacterium]|jgi:hypothetical protein|nr:hypothetical protein [Zoogloeaceae bacterium]